MVESAARSQWKIALAPGDGIGPEVMRVAADALAALGELRLQLTELAWPSTAYYAENGAGMPGDWKAQLAQYDALLLGALGDPGPLTATDRFRLTDGVSLAPLLEIRQGFDLWACERPAITIEGARQYLADPRAGELDLLVIRENSEGEYIGQGGRVGVGSPAELATQVEVFTRRGAERIFTHAFERARQRAAERAAGARRPRQFRTAAGSDAAAQVCLVTKRNALAYWGQMWTEVFAEVAKNYPDIATHHELVDAACMKFVASPWMFDVVVASNLQGDILTDLAAVLCGGMGVAPSCNINPSDRSRPPMFEPTHGSAPDIVGQDIADPRAMLLTTAMMLDWMGQEDPRAASAARRLHAAVAEDLRQHGQARRTTAAIAESILGALHRSG